MGNDRVLVAIKRPDGGVSIADTTGWVIEEYLVMWRQTQHLPELSYRIVSPADLPSQHDDLFDAWHDPGQGPLTIDMERAKNVWRGFIKAAADKKLAVLDERAKEAADAVLVGDDSAQATVKSIAQERVALRSLHATFDLSQATTPEELKALWPEQLSAV